MASEKAIEKRLEMRRSEIAKRVAECLALRGLKPLEFANMSGIKPSFISRVLSAEANLTLQTISKLELALDYRIISLSSDKTRISQREGRSGNVTIEASETFIG